MTIAGILLAVEVVVAVIAFLSLNNVTGTIYIDSTGKMSLPKARSGEELALLGGVAVCWFLIVCAVICLFVIAGLYQLWIRIPILGYPWRV